MLDMNKKFTHTFTRAVFIMLDKHMITQEVRLADVWRVVGPELLSMLHNNLRFSLEDNLTRSCIQHISDSRYQQREDK